MKKQEFLQNSPVFLPIVRAATTTPTGSLSYQVETGEIEAILHYAKTLIASVGPIIWLILGIYVAFMVVNLIVNLIHREQENEKSEPPDYTQDDRDRPEKEN